MSEVVMTWNPKALSERQQLALRMTAWGLSPQAIASTTGYSLEHVYKLRATEAGRRARERYRDSIEATVEDAIKELVPEVLNGAGASGQ